MKKYVSVVLFSLPMLIGGGSAAAMGDSKPNIVFLFADDLDADEINYTIDMVNTWATPSGARRVEGAAGVKAGIPKVLTPNIDSLAENGMLFTRFYVNATVCSPSRYCLLTGRYATRGIELQKDYPVGTHAQLDWRPAILREETNLPKELQKLGYRTGIIGKWHNMPDGMLTRRIRAHHTANMSFEDAQQFDRQIKEHYQSGLDYLSDGFGWDVVDRMEWGNSIVNLDWQCEGALKFIEESKDRPFFLYCALPVPHGQYSYDYNQIETYDRRVTSNGLLEEPMTLLPSNENVFERLKKAGVPKENAMATRMDDYVGAVLRKLDELGLRENTMVVFTSDHGSRGKNSVYEGGAKVPLIVQWPGEIAAGSQNESLIGSIDFAATFVELANGTLPADMAQDSRSFLTQLAGKPEPEDWRKTMLIEAGNSKGIVSKEWKFVANRVPPEIAKKMKARPKEVYWTGVDHHNYGNEKMYPSYWDADQLFDLNKDLYEQNNLAENPEYAEQLKAKRAELSKVVESLPHTFGEF